ncbi:hypothetical protein F5Y16DRAFT_368539 [Xylariaceae sp. FL0255]|nr:hypothetical protein F5Y16DRAFT_368539 [Xylariaceae sp. FL0255]
MPSNHSDSGVPIDAISWDSQEWSHVGDEELNAPVESSNSPHTKAPVATINLSPTPQKPMSFYQFEDELKARGIGLSASSTNDTPLQLAAKNERSIEMFKEDIQSSLLNNVAIQLPMVPPSLPTLTGLQDILPPRDAQASNTRGQSVMTEEDMAASNFFRTLLFSVSNGFVGLENVPQESVLKYIRRFGNTNLLLRQILQVQCHITTALVENLLRAAIEARDHEVLRTLLDIRPIDVDSIVCFDGGSKYTMLERATMLEDYATIKILIDANADTEKTFTKNGALSQLICRFITPRSHVSRSSNVLAIAQLLVEAGAKVSVRFVSVATDRRHEYDTAYFLMSHIPPSRHKKLLTSGCLVDLVDRYEEDKATIAVKRFLENCSAQDCNQCVKDNAHIVTWLLIYAAKRGFAGVIELCKGCRAEWERVLSAAIQGKHQRTIDLVLEQNPDLNAHHHAIDRHTHNFNGIWSNQRYTTSLAEAIKAGNWDLVQAIENSSGFLDIHRDSRIMYAISAAAKSGNIDLIRKYMSLYPSLEPTQMTDGLVLAILGDHDDIFWLLFEAGAEVRKQYNGSPHPADPLFAAVWKRKPDIVHAIMDAGPATGSLSLMSVYVPSSSGQRAEPHERRESTELFEVAVEWGDRSIISALKKLYPFARIKPWNKCLPKLVSRGDENLLQFLLDIDLVGLESLSSCLSVAVEKEDVELMTRLAKMGAEPHYTKGPFSQGPLAEAAASSPLMLSHLLSLVPETKVLDGELGANLFAEALKHLPTGIASLHVLLNSNRISTSSVEHTRPFRDLIRVYKEPYDPEFTLMKKFLNAGCNANDIVDSSAPDCDGNQTALMECIATGNLALVRFMVDQGANIHQSPGRGVVRTPLQYAVQSNNFEMVKLLLSLGADVNEKPAYRGGATALQLAAIKGNCGIAAELLSRGAQIDAAPAKIYGRWPLEGAVENGRLEMIDFLYRQGWFYFDKSQCERAMQLALDNGHTACRDRVGEILLAYDDLSRG